MSVYTGIKYEYKNLNTLMFRCREVDHLRCVAAVDVLLLIKRFAVKTSAAAIFIKV